MTAQGPGPPSQCRVGRLRTRGRAPSNLGHQPSLVVPRQLRLHDDEQRAGRRKLTARGQLRPAPRQWADMSAKGAGGRLPPPFSPAHLLPTLAAPPLHVPSHCPPRARHTFTTTAPAPRRRPCLCPRPRPRPSNQTQRSTSLAPTLVVLWSHAQKQSCAHTTLELLVERICKRTTTNYAERHPFSAREEGRGVLCESRDSVNCTVRRRVCVLSGGRAP